MGVVIDIILIAAVGFAVWRGAKNGAVRGVVGFVSLIVCLVLANTASRAFSGEFSGMLRPFVGGMVESKLQPVLTRPPDAEIEEGYTPPADAAEHGQAWLISEETLRRMGVFEPAARAVAASVEREFAEIGSGVNDIKTRIADVITDKLSGMFAYAAVFAVAFVLLAIACVVAGNLLNFVFSLPGLKLVDKIAGCALGLARGLLFVFVAATVLRYLGLLTARTIEQTALLEYFILHNPVATLLGL